MSDKTAEVEAALRRVLEMLSPDLEAAYKSGRRDILGFIVRLCVIAEIPVPSWAGRAFLEALATAQSWEDVLGPPPRGPTGEISEAFVLGQELRGRGFKVGDDLWNELARKLGMSAGTAKRRYYDFRGMTADEWAEYVGAVKNGTIAPEDQKYMAALFVLGHWLEHCEISQESAKD